MTTLPCLKLTQRALSVLQLQPIEMVLQLLGPLAQCIEIFARLLKVLVVGLQVNP
ncbi:hypothetical protein [Gloeobacter morelensis]|uniref:Uncharacterized protein n=1 Tax=Gloeobacter morelensis MG652769 TaxID=2781736 RepID=A0ABY3PSI9_9CYAN|nr:hypothetical protein [Gloeobacter morelensis]UFP96442.1 hypothetical protein ISF26_09615 [Gloeobacter morelensis MG652769]